MFHDSDYIEFLKKTSNQEDTEKLEMDATQYGLSMNTSLLIYTNVQYMYTVAPPPLYNFTPTAMTKWLYKRGGLS